MRSLLERTDRIDGDFVLAGHAVKQLLGTFQCACAQHLGQIVGGLIQVGKAQVLAHALERVCRTECFLHISFLQCLLQFRIAVVVQKHQRKFADHAFVVKPLEHVLIICAHLSITFLNRHGLSLCLSFSTYPA